MHPTSPDSWPKASTYFSIHQHSEKPWHIKLIINRHSIKIDARADVSIISKEMYDSLWPKPRQKQLDHILCSPGGPLPYLATFIAHADQQTISCTVFVPNNDHDSPLSRDKHYTWPCEVTWWPKKPCFQQSWTMDTVQPQQDLAEGQHYTL